MVTRDKSADGLKAEEIPQIDTFTKCVNIQELGPQSWTPQPVWQEATYLNIPHPGCDSSLLGVPYAVSAAAPAVSKQGLESSVALYGNEYCTLSAFNQLHGCSRGPGNEQHAEYEN